MKRICLMLMAAAVLLSLPGCSDARTGAQEEAFVFPCRDGEILPGAEAAPILAELGEPQSYTEEPSCAFDGMDKTYHYGSFSLTTCPVEGKDRIYRLWLSDDTVATAEGIRIGSTRQQVEEAYGAENLREGENSILTRGQTRLVILFEDGLVRSIQYEAVLE